MGQRGFQAGDPRRTRWCPLWTLCNRVCSWPLPLAGLTRTQKAGLRGFENPSQHGRSRAAGSVTGTTGTRTGPGGQPRTRAGGRVGGHLGVYLSIAEERRKMIGLSTCRGRGVLIGWLGWTHARACRRVGREEEESRETSHNWVNHQSVAESSLVNRAHAGAARG